MRKEFNAVLPSDDFLRTMIDQMPTLAWACRPDGSAEFVNRRWLDYAGLSMEEAVGWGWQATIHPEDLGKTTETWLRIVASEEPGEEEARVRRFDGEYRWFLFRAVPVRDEWGKVIRWYGTSTDIEDRKRAEEKLQRSEAYLHEAQRLGHVGSWASNAPSGYLLRIFGYDPDEKNPTLEMFRERIHPEDLPSFEEMANKARSEKTDYEFDYRIVLPDGSIRHAHSVGHPVFNDSGDLVEYIGTTLDVTERKRAEEKLRQSEGYLSQAQRLSRTGSFGWRVSTGEIVWSEETFRIFQCDPTTKPTAELILQRIHPEGAAFVKQTIERASQDGKDFDFEHRLLMPDGSIKHLHIVAYAERDKSGEFTEFIGVLMDITERKRAEEALRASEQVARGQVEALAQSLDVLATAPAPEKFIGQMLSTIARLLSAQNVTLWLFDESTDSLVLRLMADGEKPAAPDPQHPFMKDPLVSKQNRVIQELLFTAGPVVCEDLETDPRVNGEWRDYLKERGTKRFLAVPILVGGEVRGLIGVRHADRAPYRPEQIELTQALAHQVMLAIQLNEFAEQGQRAAVFEERNRMARDIHDTLAQGFTGVIIQLEAAEDSISCGQQKDADKHLHRAASLARRSLSEARRSVHALRPDALERDNLWEALKGIIKNTTAGTALHTTFELRGKLPDLPPIWQENLLHVGQEALTNALKYAHAKSFRTRLRCNQKEVRLELRDDGAGFELKDRHGGLGLTGMRERVEQMNGQLEITSVRGRGTNVVVALPLNQESVLVT
jgi:PAS domain S-box-containing protein